MRERISCDLCRKPSLNVYVDGATDFGKWGNLCPECHKTHGMGLGIGRGQQYEWDGQGHYTQVAGGSQKGRKF